MKSTSLHRITTDKGNLFYKIIVRLLYIPLNIINNRKPNKNIDPDLKINIFKPDNFEEKYKKLDDLSSPSRKLSDLFWMSLNWKKLQDELGEINICDLGCGSGKYYFKLQDYSENRINKYYGFDIQDKPEWKTIENDRIQFQKYDGKSILNIIPKDTNLIISQSAIEHFQEDVTIFKQLNSFNENIPHKIKQIHLFPSAACLKLYRFHGVRHYTPRTVSKITKLFNADSKKILFKLGGKHSNAIHLKFITGSDKRSVNKEKYIDILLEAMKKDFRTNEIKNASFYALTIN